MIDSVSSAMVFIPDLERCEALPIGAYPFRVVHVEQGPRAFEAELELELEGGSYGRCRCTDLFRICLNGKVRVATFWLSVDRLKASLARAPDWNAAIGKWGRCEVGIAQVFRDDGTTGRCNHVVSYLPSRGAP